MRTPSASALESHAIRSTTTETPMTAPNSFKPSAVPFPSLVRGGAILHASDAPAAPRRRRAEPARVAGRAPSVLGLPAEGREEAR